MSTMRFMRYKSIRLSLIEAFILIRKGKRDGKINLPRQDKQSGWSSPQCGKETRAYYEFAAKKWGETEKKNAELHREIGEKERNIINKREQLTALQKSRPAEPNLSLVYSGEAEIDPAIIRNRRQNEYVRANSRYFSKCDEIMDYIEQAQNKISEHKAAITESENITRLICERAKQRTEQRISAYWYGLLCTNTNKAIPATPGKIEESDAERVYFSHHKINLANERISEGGMAV